jgi:hypothetical protein
MTPSISSVGIRIKAKGTPMQSVSMFSFIHVFVSPKPFSRLPRLRFPKIENKLDIIYKVRKEGA